jgi:response regulator RpfG family c-di-GMP phosphodiesterase
LLQSQSIVLDEDWENLAPLAREEITNCTTTEELLPKLVAHGLLTEYQAGRVERGTLFGLMLGYYRVLDRIGAGGMGVVFKAEHVDMRRVVAIKVLPLAKDTDPVILRRFYTEIRAVAQLQHPNIVAALDAGNCPDPDGYSPTLHFFVMEYVPGQDLEEYVIARGPLAPVEACDFAHQIAAALMEAHKHSLVHRDIKPSNVRVTPDGRAKLLDFGLARRLTNRLTQPGTVLGTMDYMSPEQARDAASVDIRADIYGLGGTLFWCLTGKVPFAPKETLIQEITCRMRQTPPSARAIRPEIPLELENVLTRMMALEPADRYATPQAVLQALMPFLKQGFHDREGFVSTPHYGAEAFTAPSEMNSGARTHQILVVDDERAIRELCTYATEAEDCQCDEAKDGSECLEAVRGKRYDLVLLDVDMPGLSGREVCRALRENPPYPNLKIIMMSGRATGDELADVMLAGADDYLVKPLSLVQLNGRLKAALRLKDAQDQTAALNHRLTAANQELEVSLGARDSDLIHARNALVLALAELTGYREAETGNHHERLQQLSRCLAEEAATSPSFGSALDSNFINMLECCVPLHDIGKCALPDHILMKPGKLTAEERHQMQTHTTIGADTLKKVAEKHGFARAFLQMAGEITRHHHEHYDGQGYPDRLAGDDIPLSARIVAIADVYDALRSRRAYKPALSHDTTMRMMAHEFPGHFDPALMQAFQRSAPQFEKIFQKLAD